VGKLIMWNLVTLDGYFEGPTAWDIDWHGPFVDEEFDRFAIAQLKAAGTLVFGRKTYEGMANYWPTASGEVADLMNGMRKAVFSKTLAGSSSTWNNTRIYGGDLAVTIAELKEDAKDLLVFGSAALSSPLLKRGLFDELRIGIAPILLGKGRPLFGPLEKPIRLQPGLPRKFASGLVVHSYAIETGKL
jgi:dihydrofolate reductase